MVCHRRLLDKHAAVRAPPVFLAEDAAVRAPCAQAVAPACAASAKPLHATVIRNEAAYFGCLQQLLAAHPPPSLAGRPASHAPLFLLGDSHCLPGTRLPSRWRTQRKGMRIMAPCAWMPFACCVCRVSI